MVQMVMLLVFIIYGLIIKGYINYHLRQIRKKIRKKSGNKAKLKDGTLVLNM